VSSYDVVSFFFLFVTIVSRFTFSSFVKEVTKDPCIAENKDPQIHQHQPCGMGALR
jgi:hypothetical protein